MKEMEYLIEGELAGEIEVILKEFAPMHHKSRVD
jgi:hypothetical protein